MVGHPTALSFCWWNLQDFAHFDANRASKRRWPKRQIDFEVKRDRILKAIQDVCSGFPDLLAVCEITREAAEELRVRMSPAFDVAVVPIYPHDDGFQVAVFFRRGIGFEADLPLVASAELDVSEETRPMIPVRFTRGTQQIRFVACHWTSFDEPNSQAARIKLADYLRRDVFEFLQPKTSSIPSDRHAVILGDLNEEPMSLLFEEHLQATRDHTSGRRVTHWRDRQARRPRLYNTSWRFLGEQVAYRGGTPEASLAGTFYKRDLGWRTFDHVIVSSGLLLGPPPYLDEANTCIAVTPTMRSLKGLLQRFERAEDSGISDHLPLVGKIVLSEETP